MFIYPNPHSPSVGTMIRTIAAYIPPSIHVPTTASLPDHYKVEDGAQFLREVAADALRFYESAEKLAEDLKTFGNISCDSELFRKDMCEPYTRTPEVFEAENGKKFCLKQDFLVQLQNMAYAKVDVLRSSRVAQGFLALFLHLKEEDLRGSRQFALVCDGIDKLFDDLMKLDQRKDKLSLKEPQAVQFMRLLNVPLNQEKYGTLETLLKESGRVDLKVVYETCAKLVRVLNKIINEKPMIFKPSRGISFMTPSVIRVFEDNGLGFVPRDEMAAATGFTAEPHTGIWKTMTAERAMNMVHSRNHVEKLLLPLIFIRVPIVRTKHSARYVWNRNGVPHKLAIDVFMELMFVLMRKDMDFETMNKFLVDVSDFDYKEDDIYLLDKSKIDEINGKAQSSTNSSASVSLDDQLLEFLKRFPKWALFVHNQFGCQRLQKKTCCSQTHGDIIWMASKLADVL